MKIIKIAFIIAIIFPSFTACRKSATDDVDTFDDGDSTSFIL